MTPRSLWTEFKDFALKGNMIDLAVAVVIGAAFGAVIKSMVDNILMPLISYVTPANLAYTEWKVGTTEKPVHVGKFIGDLVNFLIVAFAVFVMMAKLVGSLVKRATAPPAGAPTTRECPQCLSMIPIKARKCAHCTSELAPV